MLRIHVHCVEAYAVVSLQQHCQKWESFRQLDCLVANAVDSSRCGLAPTVISSMGTLCALATQIAALLRLTGSTSELSIPVPHDHGPEHTGSNWTQGPEAKVVLIRDVRVRSRTENVATGSLPMAGTLHRTQHKHSVRC